MTKFFAFVDIGDVYFERGSSHPGDSVRDSHRSVSITSCIEQNRIKGEAHLMDLVDQLPLYVALEIVEFNLRKALLQLLEIILKGLAAIDFRFSFPKQIQVRTINNLDFQGNIGLKLCPKVSSPRKLPSPSDFTFRSVSAL